MNRIRNEKGQFIKGASKSRVVKVEAKDIKPLDTYQIVGLIVSAGFIIGCVISTYIK